MKIQMDTSAKTIKIESNVLFSELMEVLEKLLPKGAWKEFTLETSTVINNWDSPIIIRECVSHWTYPWYTKSTLQLTPAIGVNTGATATTSVKSMALVNGTFNVEC